MVTASEPPRGPDLERDPSLSSREADVLSAIGLCLEERETAEAVEPSQWVEFLVGPDGQVTELKLSSMFRGALEVCTRRRLGRVRFESQPEGGARWVRYPVTISRESLPSDP